MTEPATRRTFAERTSCGARADRRGARGLLVCLLGFAFEDQQQRRSPEHVAFERLDGALQPTRLAESLARRDAQPTIFGLAASFLGFFGVRAVREQKRINRIVQARHLWPEPRLHHRSQDIEAALDARARIGQKAT